MSYVLHNNPLRQLLKRIKNYMVDLGWRVYGSFIMNPPVPESVTSVVFICKGNICRSTFAHYLMQQMLHNKSTGHLPQVTSAGIKARNGEQSPVSAIEAAQSFDINMEQHRARLLTAEISESADMLIAMEHNQMTAMRKAYPDRANNIFLLPLFNRNSTKVYSGWDEYNIKDPYGRPVEEFKACYDRIQYCIRVLLDDLKVS